MSKPLALNVQAYKQYKYMRKAVKFVYYYMVFS